MKYVAYTITVILLLTSCSAAITKSGGKEMTLAGDSIGIDFTARAAAFERRKQELLEIADRTGDFIFSDDAELEALDPHAFWLMNRIMQMNLETVTADDAWAWILAMNESVEAYNRRLGREIGTVDAAVLAIGELIDIYNAGSQPELNTASYVTAILASYKAGYEYWQLIDGIDNHDGETNEDAHLRNLCYREFCEWFDLHRAATGILYGYTYAAAGYSALPMDINGLFERWARARAEELDIEDQTCWSSDRTPCRNNARRVSPRKFDKLLAYFKGRTHQDVIEEIVSDMVGMDYDYAKRRTDGCYDFDKIAVAMRSYETALRNWRVVREQIARSFKDQGQQRSYRELTRQIHTRFYNDLEELKKIQY